MSRDLEIGPRYFVPFEGLDYSADAPHFVAKQTDIALTINRESSKDAVIDAGRLFLLGPSLDLIDLMEQGIHYDNQARAGLTREELERALETTGSIAGKGTKAREAHRIAVATWAQIPQYIRTVRFGRDGYLLSRHGRFTPPTTTMDFIERSEELRTGTIDAASGRNTSPRETAEIFFRVAANLPIKEPTH